MATPDQSSALCLSCGICCDGTLFRRVPVMEDDSVIRLEAAGIAVFAEDDNSFFAQPCPCLHEKKCDIYLDRPRVCQGFSCKSLQAFESGEISFEVADARIREFWVLKARVEDELARVEPSLLGAPVLTLPRRLEEMSAGEGDLRFRPKYGKTLLLLWALFQHIKAHFHDSPEEEN